MSSSPAPTEPSQVPGAQRVFLPTLGLIDFDKSRTNTPCKIKSIKSPFDTLPTPVFRYHLLYLAPSLLKKNKKERKRKDFWA